MAKAGKRGASAAKRTRKVAGTAAEFVRRLGRRRSIAGVLILFAFGVGFYLAQVYADISELIEERHAALTSAVYSAPLEVMPGDEVGPLHLVDRLGNLSTPASKTSLTRANIRWCPVR